MSADKASTPLTHAALVLMAEHWLIRQGCGIVLRDPFYTPHVDERPDAIGWKLGASVSLLIECKTSRTDFLADYAKPFRKDPHRGMGHWRFYLTPTDVIAKADLPEGWGLLYTDGQRVHTICGKPQGNTGWRQSPFQPHLPSEHRLVLSALRRLVIRGHGHDVYQPLSEVSHE